METQRTQTVDLHVHSKYAGRFKPFVLKSLEVDECHTEPEDLYRALLDRGMSMVTITDHDAIQGCLEIAHHGPHVFISEEISARFPENGCIVHVLAYGITEAQHEEIQRLRHNIYELVPYLRQHRIVHALAHPLSSVNQRLTPELLEKSLLLFDTLEAINGQKDPSHERFMRRLIHRVDKAVLARWAERHRLPVHVEIARRWALVGGSDDHSGVTMARAFTSFEGPATIDGLRHAVRQRCTRVSGHDKNGTSFAHTAYLGTFNHFRSSNGGQRRQGYRQILDLVKAGQLPARLDELSPAVQRLVPAALEVLAEHDDIPSLQRVRAEGHRPELHDELYELAHGVLLRAFQSTFQSVKRGVEAIDLEGLIDELPTAIRLALFNLPYYFGFRFYYAERRRAQLLYESLHLDPPRSHVPRVAVLCDTLDNIDGVNLGLRRIVEELRGEGREVFLCGPQSSSAASGDDGAVVRFPVLGEFALPGYDSYTLGWPGLVGMLRWLESEQIDLVVTTTPGPMGVVGQIASRVLGIATVGHYHTNLPEYAQRLIGDRSVAQIVRAYTAWFYNATQAVVAPSYATRDLMAHSGIARGRVRVVRRGVDADRFHPRCRDPQFWRRFGLEGKCTIAYVGRISVEKNLPFLVRVVRRLFDAHGRDFELAVVGDGPWRARMQRELHGYPVAFTGTLEGGELAQAFASSDIFAFPSTTDTFGNVVLEALCSGVPAVVSDEGGPAEIVHSGDSGIIVPADDEDAWVRALAGLLGDPARRRRMGVVARQRAEAWTFARARSELWDVYERVANDHRRAVAAEFGADRVRPGQVHALRPAGSISPQPLSQAPPAAFRVD